MVPGDGGLTSKVANAGEPVSPALISPPSPLERLRIRGFSALLCPPRGANLSSEDKSGKASVAVMFTVNALPPPVKKSAGLRYHRKVSKVVKGVRQLADALI